MKRGSASSKRNCISYRRFYYHVSYHSTTPIIRRYIGDRGEERPLSPRTPSLIEGIIGTSGTPTSPLFFDPIAVPSRGGRNRDTLETTHSSAYDPRRPPQGSSPRIRRFVALHPSQILPPSGCTTCSHSVSPKPPLSWTLTPFWLPALCCIISGGGSGGCHERGGSRDIGGGRPNVETQLYVVSCSLRHFYHHTSRTYYSFVSENSYKLLYYHRF